jgi:hypothetical protein
MAVYRQRRFCAVCAVLLILGETKYHVQAILLAQNREPVSPAKGLQINVQVWFGNSQTGHANKHSPGSRRAS